MVVALDNKAKFTNTTALPTNAVLQMSWHVVFVLQARRSRGTEVHIVIASSGNSGLAAAWASKALGLRCTVFLPVGVSAPTVEYMKKEGAEVVTAGSIYLDAKRAAEKLVESESNAYELTNFPLGNYG